MEHISETAVRKTPRLTVPNSNNILPYRRGVVLGLTLAETFLLLLFVLLLAISFDFVHKIPPPVEPEKQLKALQEQLEETQVKNKNLAVELATEIENSSHLVEQLDKLDSTSDPKLSFTDAFIELRNIQKEAEQQKQQNTALQERIDQLQEKNARNEQQLQEQAEQISDYQKNEPAQNESNTKQTLETILQDSGYPTNPEALAKALEGGSGGISNEPPSCWVIEATDTNPEKKEYIFDITLQSEGLKIFERDIPSRNADKNKLPMDKIDYERMMSQESFKTSTKPFLEWGIKNDCRFYVRVFDYTGEREKLRYKDLLQTVEHSFYKYNIEDNTTTQPGEVKAP